jgi:hypothetical protein
MNLNLANLVSLQRFLLESDLLNHVLRLQSMLSL